MAWCCDCTMVLQGCQGCIARMQRMSSFGVMLVMHYVQLLTACSVVCWLFDMTQAGLPAAQRHLQQLGLLPLIREVTEMREAPARQSMTPCQELHTWGACCADSDPQVTIL